MGSADIWISVFIEYCLLRYETGQRTGLAWEDDGSNIRFPTSKQRHALINTLIEQNDVPVANLTDSDTQIDAILSRESVAQYNREFPNRPLSRDACRGYLLQLDSYELVYEYSTGKPKVHLYVKRFRITWEREKVRAPPSGKSVGKKPALVTHLRRVFTVIESRRRRNQEAVGADGRTGNRNEYSDILASQATNDQAKRRLQPHQLCSDPDLKAPKTIPVHHSAHSGSLLGHLRHRQASENLHPRFASPRDAVVLNPVRASEPPVRNSSTSGIPSNGDEHRRSHESTWNPAAGRVAAPQYESISSQPLQTQLQTQADAEQFLQELESAINVPTRSEPQSPEKVIEKPQSSFSPDQQLKSHLESVEGPNIRSADFQKDPIPNTVDPWEGMTEIRSVDVTVPKDQMAILESDKKPWYPPPVGETMVSGNVPPALLDEWNKIAFQRNQQASDDKTESVEDEFHTSPSTPVHESTPESSSGEEVTDWSVTPNRTPTRNRLLPESSPVRRETMPQKSRRASLEKQDDSGEAQQSKTQNIQETHLVPGLDEEPSLASKAPEVLGNGTLNEDVAFDTTQNDDQHDSDDNKSDAEMGIPAEGNSKPDARIVVSQPVTDTDAPKDPAGDGVDSDNDSASSALARQLNAEPPGLEADTDDGHASDNGDNAAKLSISSVSKPQSENDVPISQADTEAAAPQTAMQDDEYVCDSSSDSEMDVAIPQPLSGSTQQTKSSQAEAVSSSLPFSERSRHVQVAETPAVAPTKSRVALPSQDAYFPGPGNAGIQSQPHKSSSQSRILDTYPSNEDSRGETSQESSRSFPATAPANVNGLHVMGTPMNSEGPATQPTPWSESTFYGTSSAPEVTAASNGATSAHQSESSKAFSLCRDLPPSSMLSMEDDHRSPIVQSSAQENRLPDIRALSLKRFASELDDSERGSPSKRSKTDIKRPIFQGSLRESISNRRQSFNRQKCDIKSSQSLEASDAYERFRGHYPSYTGDFEHFTKQCARLQAFRRNGSLQRSFLWDDFIIKHLEDYHSYIVECLENQTKSLTYEEYFTASFSKPTYKKRSLTVEGIDACAAQVITRDETPDSQAMNDSKTSFTASLRDRLSAFHTYSSFAAPQDPLSHDKQLKAGDGGSDDEDTDIEWDSSQRSIPDSEPARSAARRDFEEPNLDTIHETIEQAIASENEDETEEEDGDEDMNGDEDEDMEDADVDLDMDRAAREKGSVELGDEEPPSRTPVPHLIPDPPQVVIPTLSMNNFRGPTPRPLAPANAQSPPKGKGATVNTSPPSSLKPSSKAIPEPNDRDKIEAEAEAVEETQAEEAEAKDDENENWFLSLRHINPILNPNSNQANWSDDPNTPFKKWARADQDVLLVRNRRGGAHVQLDEQGVIKRFPRA
ncbi:hypothetical protein BDV18DRAFT_161876 [Aspergillus unguis]